MHFRPRDAQGWRIPAEGTKIRRIYELMLKGYPPGYIAALVGGSVNSTRVLMWQIRHPEKHNFVSAAYKRMHRIKDVSI